jgi:glycosyltransferase
MSADISYFIVTPCFNGMPWLPACIASVKAQAGPGIKIHHHVQDGGSSDGTVDWLAEYGAQQQALSNYQLTFESVADNGMYDAINRGWDRADESFDWLGHLNSDEQYQPGLFQKIAAAGEKHPEWGAITGNSIWVDGEGNYLCSRKPSIGWPWVGRVWIPAFTCALFIRRNFYGSNGVRFDTSWKSFGDKVFCRDLLNIGCRFAYMDQYMALFVHRGDENLGFQPITEVERKRYWNECLTSWEKLVSKLSIFAAKISRVLRCRLGKSCQSYTWFDDVEKQRHISVEQHRWNIG